MITFKDRVYSFEEIEEKVLAGEIDNDKDFIIEALRSCFYTEDGMTVVDENGVTIMTNEAHKNIMGIDGREIVGQRPCQRRRFSGIRNRECYEDEASGKYNPAYKDGEGDPYHCDPCF